MLPKRAVAGGMSLTYVAHGAGNISSGRNEALRHARRLAPLVALLDDDEVPEATWLAELVGASSATGADIVTGPVLARFPAGSPDGSRAGGLYSVDGPSTVHGSPRPSPATCASCTAASIAPGSSSTSCSGCRGGGPALLQDCPSPRRAPSPSRQGRGCTNRSPRAGWNFRYLLRREYRKGGHARAARPVSAGLAPGPPGPTFGHGRVVGASRCAAGPAVPLLPGPARGRSRRGHAHRERSAGMLVGLAGRTTTSTHGQPPQQSRVLRGGPHPRDLEGRT